MANLERRILTLETTRGPQDEFDDVLQRTIPDRMNRLDEHHPAWFVELISDPDEWAKNMVRRLATLGFLTPKQRLILRNHSAMKRPEVTDGI